MLVRGAINEVGIRNELSATFVDPKQLLKPNALPNPKPLDASEVLFELLK